MHKYQWEIVLRQVFTKKYIDPFWRNIKVIIKNKVKEKEGNLEK